MGEIFGGKFSQRADIGARREKNRIAEAKREQERNPINERIYGRTLNLMGREAYLREYFDGILLENQTFPKIGDIEDVTKTVNFVTGYKSEMARIDNARIYGYLDKIEEEYKTGKTR